MKLKKLNNKTVIIAASVILVAFAAIIADVSISRKKGILSNIRFSGAYSDCNGNLLEVYRTPDDRFRIYKSITDFPPDFIEALLLQEDKRFYNHNGVNVPALFRSFIDTYIKRSRRIGGSTITMQVAKLKYNLYTKNIVGKLTQILAAKRLELIYSKQQILDAYVNLAPCGKNIEGFETASQYFFNKSIKDLELSEKMMLCVLPQNPNKRCPYPGNVSQELMDARHRLFSAWIESHPEDVYLEEFFNHAPDLICRFVHEAPHFTRDIELNRSEKSFYGTSGVVRTTLDLSMQKFFDEQIKVYVSRNSTVGVNNASAVLVDTETMSVKAYVGSKDFNDDAILGQVDGVAAKRSPGSTLKPFIYGLAMEQGIIHYDTMLKDTPSSFSEYTPDNYGNTFKGPVKAWYALTQSRNIPAVNLARKIKNPDLYDFLQEGGISELKAKETYGLSIVLGSADVSAIELCSLYSIFLNKGVQYEINKTYPLKNKIAELGKHLLSEESSYIVKQMLFQNKSPVEARPEGAEEIPIGFKTGTSIGFRDCWSAGFFGKYVLCIWIGNFDGVGNNSFIGRKTAAPLFFNIADGLFDKGYVSKVMDEMPEKVTKIKVCSVSGCLCNDDCPYQEETYFIPGVSPIDKCKIHRRINVDMRTGYRTDEDEGKNVKSVVREYWPSDLMELFKQAGLPRLVPPDYPPEEKNHFNQAGYPPEIISPLANTQYVFDPEIPSRNVIILNATADGGAKELFWFNNASFICRTKPGEKFEWRPAAGEYEITVLDDKGRSASRKVRISDVYEQE